MRADAARNRELLLDAAVRAFATDGPEATLDGIAKSGDLRKPVVGSPIVDSRWLTKPRLASSSHIHSRATVTFGTSRWPFTLARPEAVDYSAEKFPGTFAGLEQALVLPWNERMTDEHIDFLGDSIIEAAASLEAT